MPDLPAPVASQIKTPDAMQSLGSVMNFANTAQNLQRGGVALQQEQQDLGERNALNAILKNIDKPEYKNEDGSPNFDRLREETTKVAPKFGPKFMEGLQAAHRQSLAIKSDLLGIAKEQRGAWGQILMSAKGLPIDKVHALLDLGASTAGLPQSMVDAAKKHLSFIQSTEPDKLPDAIQRLALSTTSVPEQVTARTPQGPVIGSGQGQQMYNVKETAGPTGPVPGTFVQAQLPPETRIVDPKTLQTKYLGSQPQQQGQQFSAAPPLGAETRATGAANVINKDWETTLENARTASTDIANLQNIKRFSHGAATGVMAERRALASGAADLFKQWTGQDLGSDTKTNTDLLMKNAHMLVGGNSDLARIISEAANPNIHMTETAIREAANQVISQRQMALAKQQFLQPHNDRNDSASYGKALTEWNKIADPRIFQWQHMTPEEKADMKAKMTKVEQQQFRAKVKRAVDLGVVQ